MVYSKFETGGIFSSDFASWETEIRILLVATAPAALGPYSSFFLLSGWTPLQRIHSGSKGQLPGPSLPAFAELPRMDSTGLDLVQFNPWPQFKAVSHWDWLILGTFLAMPKPGPDPRKVILTDCVSVLEIKHSYWLKIFTWLEAANLLRLNSSLV